MEKKKPAETKDWEGRLPAVAPLANAFVPFQPENPSRYEARKGMVRGTLFPGLDLPFMGMVNQEKRLSPMTEMQAMAFAIQELALYLDTHPEDKEALELYQNYQKIYHKGMMDFNEESPVKHGLPASGDRYRWLDDPWPWEYAANKEVSACLFMTRSCSIL